MAMVGMKALPGTTGMRRLESRIRWGLFAFSVPRPQFLLDCCRTRLTRKIESGGQNDFSWSLMRRGHSDMPTGCRISHLQQRGSSTLHVFGRRLLQRIDSAGWRICGRRWAVWTRLTRPWQSTSSPTFPMTFFQKWTLLQWRIVSKHVLRFWIMRSWNLRPDYPAI